ncbi:hypothetical protein [Tenacibaculum ascidiaceicola]|uniref:hypothetical protein n=1 Tax=Tenacibaculum ascidiaceicola TaxID=1699411 RepID=UPI003CE49BB5
MQEMLEPSRLYHFFKRRHWSNRTNGADGVDGKSAYQTWLDAGNTGTKADFITSLKGDTGATGANGADGVDGKSAYQTWLDAGNTWNQSRFYYFFKRTLEQQELTGQMELME